MELSSILARCRERKRFANLAGEESTSFFRIPSRHGEPAGRSRASRRGGTSGKLWHLGGGRNAGGGPNPCYGCRPLSSSAMGSLWQGRGRASTGHTANQPAGREHHLSEEIRWGSRGASAAAATPEENPIHAMAAGHGAARPWGACGRG